MDSLEAKKSEFTFLHGELDKDLRKYISGATSDFNILMGGITQHQSVLQQLPSFGAEVANIKAANEKIQPGVQEQLTRKDAEAKAYVDGKLAEVKAYLDRMEARLQAVAPTAVATDPWAAGRAAGSAGAVVPVPGTPPGMPSATTLPVAAPSWCEGKGGRRREYYPHKKAEPGVLKTALEWRD